MVKNYTFITSDGEKLQASAFFNEHLKTNRTLVFVHGFKGFKDWGFGPYIGEYFSNNGFSVITFNFSHNGVGEIFNKFTEFEKLADNTFSREVLELNEMVDAIRNGFFLEIPENCNIGICGHSRGGAVSLLTSVQRDDINAVSVWASISRLDRYSPRQKEEWRKKGSFDVMNMRTKQVMRLNVSLLDDLEKNQEGILSIENAVKNLNKLLLIAHGDQDLAVKIDEAEELYEWSDKSKTELFKLFGTGHTFDVVHPFAGSTPKFDKLLDKTLKFFKNNL
jgi:uncharacterized protein